FTPFIAEEIYKQAGGEKESVHLEDWPSFKKAKKGDTDLVNDMEGARKIVSLGLEARSKAGIKVRQPLTLLKIKSNPPRRTNLKSQEQLLGLIKDELNVKEVIYDDKISSEVELDTVVTPSLKEEGELRELIRALQDARKKAGLFPGQKIALEIAVDSATQKFLKKFEDEIKKTAGIEKLEMAPGVKEGQEIKINDKMLRFKIVI
ncbi:MAG: DUF5915 domain-containing protein, partial [Patescibacteria group bacterium]